MLDKTNKFPSSISEATNSSEVRLQVILESAHSIFPIGQLNAASLAYLGDAVYELYVRSHYLLPPKKISDYHSQVVAQVRAETQATYLQILEPYLTDLEKDIVRRGRNCNTKCPRRLSPQVYQQATSFESLIGYLYLTDTHRLHQLFRYINSYL